MSDNKSRVPDNLAPKMKDTAILLGWISALIIIASLTWYFTQPLRNSFLIRAVNKVLEQSGDYRRLIEPLSARSLGMGSWYTMAEDNRRRDSANDPLTEGTRAYVFTFIGEGTFFPCIAVVTSGGNAVEFIPLNSYGRGMIKRVSPGILRIYTSRIEGLKP